VDSAVEEEYTQILGGEGERYEYEFVQMQTVDLLANALPFARSAYQLNTHIGNAGPMLVCAERASFFQPQGEVHEFDEEMLDRSNCSSSSFFPDSTPETPRESSEVELEVPSSPFPKSPDGDGLEDEDMDCAASEVDMIDMNNVAIAQLLADMGDERTAREIRQLVYNRR
jgi:hypothetical protein